MNLVSSIFPILSHNKALERVKRVITTSEVGSRKYLIAHESLFWAIDSCCFHVLPDISYFMGYFSLSGLVDR